MNQNERNDLESEIKKLKKENLLLKQEIEKKNKFIEGLKKNYKLSGEAKLKDKKILEKLKMEEIPPRLKL